MQPPEQGADRVPCLVVVPSPPWAQPVDVERCDRFEDVDYHVLQGLRAVIEAQVWRLAARYLDGLPPGNAFPDLQRLTGECYLSAERYWVQDEPWFARVGRQGEVCFSFFVRCLERQTALNAADRDYLGLEVHFRWQRESGGLQWVATDSSSI